MLEQHVLLSEMFNRIWLRRTTSTTLPLGSATKMVKGVHDDDVAVTSSSGRRADP